MKHYYIKQIIKYSILSIILILATIFVYDKGISAYQKYLDNNKDDETWIRANINLIEDTKIGSGILRANMPNNLAVSRETYEEVITEEIDKLLINNYKINDPLLIYDPYLNNPTTLNIYFHTGNSYKFEYYVTTESIGLEEDITYIRMTNEDGDIVSNKHFYVLEGLVPGKKNNLLIRILDDNNQVVGADNFILNVPKISNKITLS